jgi:bifunctional non-homologous end joining protein LigD
MSLKSGAQWTVRTAREYLSFQRDDPWGGYWACSQDMTPAMAILGFEASKARPRRSRTS